MKTVNSFPIQSVKVKVEDGMARIVNRVEQGTIRIVDSLENKIVDAVTRALEFDDMRGG